MAPLETPIHFYLYINMRSNKNTYFGLISLLKFLPKMITNNNVKTFISHKGLCKVLVISL